LKLQLLYLLPLETRRYYPSGCKKFERFNSGDVKGTITDTARYHFASNDVRRHRLISVSYISLLPCHGTARWHGRGREGVGGNRKEPDNR